MGLLAAAHTLERLPAKYQRLSELSVRRPAAAVQE